MKRMLMGPTIAVAFAWTAPPTPMAAQVRCDSDVSCSELVSLNYQGRERPSRSPVSFSTSGISRTQGMPVQTAVPEQVTNDALLTRLAPTLSVAPTAQSYRSVGASSVTLSYSTPTYVSLDAPRSASLAYTSGAAKPVGFLVVDATDSSTDAPAKMSLVVKNWSGVLIAETFYVAAHGTSRLAAQWDATGLGTGTYNYITSVRTYWSDGSFSESAPQTVRVLILNDNSNVAPGWGVVGFQHLYGTPSGGTPGLTLTQGDGTALFFRQACDPGCHYVSPANDFSTLAANTDGTFTRSFVDGSKAVFNAQGLISYADDRFSNRQSYAWRWTTESSPRPVPASITDPVGKVISFTYPDGVHLGSITDPAGRVSGIAYSAAGDLSQITAPDGVVELGVTYQDHRAVSWWNRMAATTTAYYDHNSRLSVLFDAQIALANGTSVYPKHMLTSYETAVLPLQNMGTSASPSPRVIPENAEMVVTDPNGNVTAMALTSTGEPWRVRDPVGRTSSIEYNASGQPIRVLASNGDAVSYEWNGVELSSVTDEAMATTITNTYTSDHRLLTSTGIGSDIVNEYRQELDEYGYPTGKLTDLIYTKVGSAAVFQDAEFRPGHVKTSGLDTYHTYDITGWKNEASASRSDGIKLYYRYDNAGRLARVVNMRGDSTLYTYDAINRPTSVTDPSGNVTTFGYSGTSSWVTDVKGQTYTTRRNALGWVVSNTDPRGVSDSVAYDPNGNAVKTFNRRGQAIVYGYDGLDRISTQDADGVRTTFSYDPNGRWTAGANGESVDTTRTDRLVGWWTRNIVTNQTSVRNAISYKLQTTADIGGHVLDIVGTGASGDPHRYSGASYAYMDEDQSYRLLGIGEYQTMGQPHTALSYDDSLRATNVSLVNGQTIRVTSGSVTYGSAAINAALGVVYGRDWAERIVGRRSVAGDSTRFFMFERLGRLTTFGDSVRLAQTLVERRSTVLSYDAIGNPTHNGASVVNGNRLVQFGPYTVEYDADGNMTHKFLTSNSSTFNQQLTWNSLGQLVTVVTTRGGVSTAITYGYDSLGRRIRKATPAGTTTWVYDGDQVAMELDGSGNKRAEYSYYPGVDRPYRMIRGGQAYYYLADGAANIVGLLDSAGQLTNEYHYSPFGLDEVVREGVVNPFRYAGRELDAETGFYYYRARYYDPQLQRFISADPLRLEAGLNGYAYAGNDPINQNDPSGLKPICKDVNEYSTNPLKPYYTITGNGYCYDPMAPWPKTRLLDSNQQWGNRSWGDPASELAYQQALVDQRLADANQGEYQMQSSAIGSIPGGGIFSSGLVPDLPYTHHFMVSYVAPMGEEATAYWASRYNQSGNRFFAVAGSLAALGSKPEATLGVLGAAEMFSGGFYSSPPSEFTFVSRWGRPGLEPGDWVMLGKASPKNYLLSFKWEVGFGNEFAPYRSGNTYEVPTSSVAWPTGWGIDGWVKGLFGQRIYRP